MGGDAGGEAGLGCPIAEMPPKARRGLIQTLGDSFTPAGSHRLKKWL
jgi:hypothetical protein